jgi:hypothetical protein
MPDNAPHNALRAAVSRAISEGSPVITEQRAPFVPPAVQGVIVEIERCGYHVKVRKTRNGSNRYSVNGRPEIDGHTLIKRFDACKYPPIGV